LGFETRAAKSVRIRLIGLAALFLARIDARVDSPILSFLGIAKIIQGKDHGRTTNSPGTTAGGYGGISISQWYRENQRTCAPRRTDDRNAKKGEAAVCTGSDELAERTTPEAVQAGDP
jgi:hypothetical protein